jgi:hypothetical protein
LQEEIARLEVSIATRGLKADGGEGKEIGKSLRREILALKADFAAAEDPVFCDAIKDLSIEKVRFLMKEEADKEEMEKDEAKLRQLEQKREKARKIIYILEILLQK